MVSKIAEKQKKKTEHHAFQVYIYSMYCTYNQLDQHLIFKLKAALKVGRYSGQSNVKINVSPENIRSNEFGTRVTTIICNKDQRHTKRGLHCIAYDVHTILRSRGRNLLGIVNKAIACSKFNYM